MAVPTKRRSFLKGAGAALFGSTAAIQAAREHKAAQAETPSQRSVNLLEDNLEYFQGRRITTDGYVEKIDERDITVFESDRDTIRRGMVDILELSAPDGEASIQAFAYQTGVYGEPLPRGMTWEDAVGQTFNMYGRVERYLDDEKVDDPEEDVHGPIFELHDAYAR